MRAIVNTGPGTLQWLEMPMPEPAPGQVRVRTLAVGICATDLQMIDGWERTGFPSVPGHEWSGEVDAVGEGVRRALLGKRCVAENVLADGGEVGFEHPGGYGEYLLTEAANVHLLPDGFAAATAALIEPLAVCLRAMGRARVRERAPTHAMVIGDGPIGLIAVMLLGRAGVGRVTLLGGRDTRLALGRELGAATTLNYHETGDIDDGYPLVVEASGSASGINTALQAAAPGGRLVVLGDYGPERAGFFWNYLLHRELEIIGSNTGAGAWAQAVRLTASEALPLGRLISHRLPADQFATALELARTSPDAVKVVLDW